jgi:hypothetical protein
MCFSLGWLQQILIYLVVIGAIFAIIKLVVPLALTHFGAAGGVLAQIINILMWAFIVILIIYIAFAVISCLMGSGGIMPPRIR